MNREARLIIVGDGGSGKTSIAKAFISNDFDHSSPSTFGVNIFELDVSILRESIRLNIWDFGGQEEQHSMHQVFFTNRSVFLLVVDARSESNAEQWLDLIKFYAPNSSVVIAISKIDLVGNYDLNRRYLLEKYPIIRSIIRTSSKEMIGIQEVLQEIGKAIIYNDSIGLRIPSSFLDLKNRLDEKGFNYTSIKTFLSIVNERSGFRDREQSVLRYFHDLGWIYYNPFNEILRNIVIINQRWLTAGMFELLSTGHNSKNGIVDIKSMVSVFENNKMYPVKLIDVFIELLTHFQVGLKIDDEQILIPTYLNKIEPQTFLNLDSAIVLLLEFEFLPLVFINSLFIRLYEDVYENIIWRSGIVLYSQYFKSYAVIRIDANSNRIEVKISGNQSREYLSTLRKAVNEVSLIFSQIKYDEKIKILGEDNVFVSYNHLIVLESKGINEFIPPGSLNSYYVSEILAGIHPEGELPSQDEIDEVLNNLLKRKAK